MLKRCNWCGVFLTLINSIAWALNLIESTDRLQNVRVGDKTFRAGEFLRFFECTGRLQNVRVGYKMYGAGEFEGEFLDRLSKEL